MIALDSILTPVADEAVHFLLDDVLGQAELGDAVEQHAAGRVEGLEDRDVVAVLDELARGGQAGGAGADDRDLLAGRRRGVGLRSGPGAPGPVGDEALEVADGDRAALLGADAAASRTASPAGRRGR